MIGMGILISRRNLDFWHCTNTVYAYCIRDLVLVPLEYVSTYVRTMFEQSRNGMNGMIVFTI